MKHLWKFAEYIIEALRNDPHLEERETERLMEASEIKLSPEVMSALREAGIPFPSAQKEILAMVKNEVRSAIKQMLRIDYPPAKSYILPVKKFEFEVDGKTFPIDIIAYSKGKGDKINKHVGSSYYIPCYKNKFYTLFLLSNKLSDDDIIEMSSDHLNRIFGEKTKSIMPPSSDFVSTLVIDNGKIVKKKEEGMAKTVEVTGQWNLAPGREFKFWMPARNSWVRGEIVKVDNDPAYKSDKFFKIEMLVDLDGKKVKMLKKVNPEDKLLIPVKTEDGEVDVPVVVHDSLYVIDKRAGMPILKIK